MEKKSLPGFSLIEVLISASIMLVALSFSVMLFSESLSKVAGLSDFDEALLCLQGKIEGLKSLPFDELSSMDGAVFGDGRGSIAIKLVASDLAQIKASYRVGKESRQISISTLASRY